MLAAREGTHLRRHLAARGPRRRAARAGRLRARHASSTSRSSSPTALDGELRGFYNVCRHRAGPGRADRAATASRCSAATTAGPTASTARCAPARRWRRPRTSARRTSACMPVRVERWGPFVFVNLDPTLRRRCPRSWARFPPRWPRAGYDVERMRLVERREYVIECNWKVYVDNYLEGYHLPIAHPAALQGARLRRLPGRGRSATTPSSTRRSAS